jgi:hypothetical protein
MISTFGWVLCSDSAHSGVKSWVDVTPWCGVRREARAAPWLIRAWVELVSGDLCVSLGDAVWFVAFAGGGLPGRSCE